MTGGLVSYPPEPSDWGASLRARLFDQRIVFLTGPLSDEVAGHVAMELMTLDATGDSAVQLQLESPGGELGAAMSVMDVIDTMGVPVTGVALGLVGGPAVGILAACQKRLSMPNARFHLCEPDASFTGDARSVERWLEHRRRQWARYCERLAAALGKPAEQVEAVLADGPYLGADEARAMGLVHEIARAPGEVTALRRGGWPGR
jgi:ATP-dependent Clp protease, protease subunit